MQKYFDYDDINLVPKFGILNSRSESDTTIKLGKHKFKIPVVPANMTSVINAKIAEDLVVNGYFYIMHRFLSFDTITHFIKTFNENNLISSISVGVTEEWYDFIKNIKKHNIIPDYITIDIAHGHSQLMIDMIKFIKNELPDTFLIAGNISTIEGANALSFAGADAVKVGIAPGSVCTTYHNTGFGSRHIQASVVQEISKNVSIPVIADGNIKYPGDVNKALVMGATMVMVGGMFSNLLDSPNSTNIVEIDNIKYVEYFGSASANMGKTNRIEGTRKLNKLIDRTYLEQMIYIQDGIESGISYGGGKDLSIFNTTEYIIKK